MAKYEKRIEKIVHTEVVILRDGKEIAREEQFDEILDDSTTTEITVDEAEGYL